MQPIDSCPWKIQALRHEIGCADDTLLYVSAMHWYFTVLYSVDTFTYWVYSGLPQPEVCPLAPRNTQHTQFSGISLCRACSDRFRPIKISNLKCLDLSADLDSDRVYTDEQSVSLKTGLQWTVSQWKLTCTNRLLDGLFGND